MRKYSPIGKVKYLLPFLFFIIFLQCGYAGAFPQTDTSKAAKADSSKKAPQDSIKPAGDTSAQQLPDSVIYNRNSFKAEELIRGERLFYGLAYLKEVAVNCASCHNTTSIDTMNWNPDALEISRKYYSKTAFDLSKVLLRPTGQKMAEVHKNFHLSPEDIVLIKAYMNEFVDIGLKPVKPVITNLFLFIIASILLLFSIIDLTISKIIKKTWFNLFILTVTGVYITYALVINAIAIGRSKDYTPVQPVKFSHAGSCRTESDRLHLLSQLCNNE